jgi:hypothetical protein
MTFRDGLHRLWLLSLLRLFWKPHWGPAHCQVSGWHKHAESVKGKTKGPQIQASTEFCWHLFANIRTTVFYSIFMYLLMERKGVAQHFAAMEPLLGEGSVLSKLLIRKLLPPLPWPMMTHDDPWLPWLVFLFCSPLDAWALDVWCSVFWSKPHRFCQAAGGS